MGYLPIVQKNAGSYASAMQRSLPAFYMEDFSVLGIQVSDCDRAVRILNQQQFALKQDRTGMAVAIDGPSHMDGVMQALRQAGLDCELADVADGMYQG